MIADKVIPCFYLVEVEGEAANAIFNVSDHSVDYGIHRIGFSSEDFPSDMHAAIACDKVCETLRSAVDDTQEWNMDVNPLFYPNVTYETSEENEMHSLEMEDIAAGVTAQKQDQRIMAIPITTRFDKLGDYVVSRKTVEGADYKVIGRVVANFDGFSSAMAQVRMDNANPSLSQLDSPISFH